MMFTSPASPEWLIYRTHLVRAAFVAIVPKINIPRMNINTDLVFQESPPNMQHIFVIVLYGCKYAGLEVSGLAK